MFANGTEKVNIRSKFILKLAACKQIMHLELYHALRTETHYRDIKQTSVNLLLKMVNSE